MDVLQAAAVEEVAAEGPSGCYLSSLWTLLESNSATAELPLDSAVKQSLWQHLCHLSIIHIAVEVQLPGLHPFRPERTDGQSVDFRKGLPQLYAVPNDLPSVQSAENAETLGGAGVILLASQTAQDCAVGLYDHMFSDHGFNPIMRETLQRLAKARAKGLVQADLAKALGVSNNNYFYVLRSLETRGLIVRHNLVVHSHTGWHHKQTNMLHLARYAEDVALEANQRFEIPKGPSAEAEDETDGAPLTVHDDLPAMREICKLLDEAQGKVLVRSELKVKLNYRHAKGHRAWRRLQKRLEAASLVEVFKANVDGKVVDCIKLVRPFDGEMEPKTEEETEGGTVRRGEATELVAELPLERQIWAMVHQTGQEGVFAPEVWKRLGIDCKRYHYLLASLVKKGCLTTEVDNANKSTIYRLRSTSLPDASPEATVLGDAEDARYVKKEKVCILGAKSATPEGATCRTETSEAGDLQLLASPGDWQFEERKDSVLGKDSPSVASMVSFRPTESVIDTPSSQLGVLEAPGRGRRPHYPMNKKRLQHRERLVMNLLQERPFVIVHELQALLQSTQPAKAQKQKVDRKTVKRVLLSLQEQGLVKLLKVFVPGATNGGKDRSVDLLLLPSNVFTPDLLEDVHKCIRRLEREARPGIPRQRLEGSPTAMPVLSGLQRLPGSREVDRLGKMRERERWLSAEDPFGILQKNGYVMARMIRVRLWHQFLWQYVTSSRQFLRDGTGHFQVHSAMLAMPLRLFLQIIGSQIDLEDLLERSPQNLSLADLPPRRRSSLLDGRANSHVSQLLDVLRRLKLVRLEIDQGPVFESKMEWHHPEQPHSGAEATLVFVLEGRPYIEEPAGGGAVRRITFDLSLEEGMASYWSTLEFVYAKLEQGQARTTFPGNVVRELYSVRAWCSDRVMTWEQRRKLLQRLQELNSDSKNNAAECGSIASDLGLSLNQVVSMMYARNSRMRLQTLQRAQALPGPSRRKSLPAPRAVNAMVPHVKPQKHPLEQETQTMELEREPPHVQAYKRQRTHAQQVAMKEHRADSEVPTVLSLTRALEEEDRRNASYVVKQRAKRVQWTEALDRDLVILYGTFRSQHPRMQWHHQKGLPFGPQVCRRRMAALRMDGRTRHAVAALVALLTRRYCLWRACSERSKEQEVSAPCQEVAAQPCVRNTADGSEQQSLEGAETDSTASAAFRAEAGVSEKAKKAALKWSEDWAWDDPNQPQVAAALAAVMTAWASARPWKSRPARKKRSIPGSTRATSLSPLGEEREAHLEESGSKQGNGTEVVNKKQSGYAAGLHKAVTDETVRNSPRAAAAVELIKALLLNSTPEGQYSELLVAGLRRLGDEHVVAAFEYLRERELVVAGRGVRPFAVSQRMLETATFMPSCGRDAHACLAWLAEHSAQALHGWLLLPTEQRSGHLLQVLSLLASEEVLAAPFLPSVGFGESLEGPQRRGSRGEHLGRRIRGFPNLLVGIQRQVMGMGEMLALATDGRETTEGEAAVGIGVDDGVEGLNDSRNGDEQEWEEEDQEEQEVDSTRGFGSDETLATAAEGVQEGEEEGTGVGPMERISCNAPQRSDESESEAVARRSTLKETPSAEPSLTHSSSSEEQLNAVVKTVIEAGEHGLTFEELASAIFKTATCKGDLEELVNILEGQDKLRKVNAFNEVRLMSSHHAACFFLQPHSITGASTGGFAAGGQHGGDSTLTLTSPQGFRTGTLQTGLSCQQLGPTGENRDVFSEAMAEGGSSSAPHLETSQGHVFTAELVPIRPWLGCNGELCGRVLEGFRRRILHTVLFKPGIPEEQLIDSMDTVTPQSCRDLLQALVLDGSLRVRTAFNQRPSSPFQSRRGCIAFQKSVHYFVNPAATHIL